MGLANKQAAYASRIQNNNQLYGQKANIETQLKNQSALNAQGINGQNLAKLDQYDMNKYNQTLMQQSRKSANVSQGIEDIGQIGTERSMRNLDNSRISHIQKMFNNNDAAAYKEYEDFYSIATPQEKQALKETLSKSESGKKKWNTDPRNRSNQITE